MHKRNISIDFFCNLFSGTACGFLRPAVATREVEFFSSKDSHCKFPVQLHSTYGHLRA